MRKFKLFIAQTLDGYIATKDESLDWLFAVEGEGDNGYSEFMEQIDTVVMGKKTYDWVMAYEKGNYPYGDLQSYIFSSAGFQTPEGVTAVSGSVTDWATGEQQKEGRDIWVIGGGQLIRQFLEAGLVDELVITTAPVLLGDGIPLFPQGEYQLNLELIGMKQYGQFAETSYRVKR